MSLFSGTDNEASTTDRSKKFLVKISSGLSSLSNFFGKMDELMCDNHKILDNFC